MATKTPERLLNQIKRVASNENYYKLSGTSARDTASSFFGSFFGSNAQAKPSAPSAPSSSSSSSSSSGSSGILGGIFSASAPSTSGANGANGFQLSHMIAYVFAILCVLMIIILFVHFFITPIFRLRPGTPGLIPVPGFDDGILYWSSSSALLPNATLPIRNQSYGYSLHVDIFIENPLALSPQPRLLFHRGGVLKDKPSGETMLGILTRYNVAVALAPDTNDLIVSVLNKNHGMETSVLSNVPVQTPFRLSMVIMEQGMEVYLNGQLMRTRRFHAAPLDIKGDIVPTPGLATLRQLKLWGRILSASEIREATPALTTANDFNLGPIPSSTSCGDASVPTPLSHTLSDASTSTMDAAAAAAASASSRLSSTGSSLFTTS